jgi:hypothetical protein
VKTGYDLDVIMDIVNHHTPKSIYNKGLVPSVSPVILVILAMSEAEIRRMLAQSQFWQKKKKTSFCLKEEKRADQVTQVV